MSPGVQARLRHLLHGQPVARLGGADEVVERDVEAAPHRAELALHPVAVRERVQPLLARTLVDVLRVLVVAHQEMGVDTGTGACSAR